MNRRRLWTLWTLLAALATTMACQRTALEVVEPHQVYTCLRTSAPITLDGKLDEAVWSQASAAEPFVRFVNDETQAVAQQTQARMAWDDRFLYIAYHCQDADVWSLMEIEDELLCREEVVEAFIDPDGDGRNYVEIEVNPANAHIDLLITHPRKVKGWEKLARWDMKGLRTATHVTGTLNQRGDIDQGWTCEIAVPFEALGNLDNLAPMPPREGDRWRIQLFRFDRPDPADVSLAECTSWSPTDTWHHPANFGTVIFAGE